MRDYLSAYLMMSMKHEDNVEDEWEYLHQLMSMNIVFDVIEWDRNDEK